MTKFSKTQKGIIVLSSIWTIITLLVAAGIADSGNRFNLVEFLAVLVALTFPIWIYWAGVWIWGFGYLLKLVGRTRQLSHTVLRGLLVLLTIGFAWASVAFILSGVGIEIPPSLNGILVVLAGSAIRQQKDKWKIGEFSNRQLYLSTFVAILTCVLAYSGVGYLKERNLPDKIMGELEATYPVYKSIKTYEPEMYEKIKAAIVSGLKEKKSVAQINDSISPILMGYVQKKMLYTPDTTLVNYSKTDLQVAKDLSSTAPDKCVSILMGRPHGDLGTAVRKESMDAELAALNEIIISPKGNNPKVATDEESQAILAPILIKEANTFNIPTADISNYVEGTKDPSKSCLFLMAVMEDLFSLPTPTVAAVLRNGRENP